MVFSAQVIPRWWGDSIIMDEEWNLTAAYYYLTKGDVLSCYGTTAPGALCAIPLLAMGLKLAPGLGIDWRTRSLSLIFMDNPGRLEAITVWSRAVDLLIGLLIGFLLYRLVRKGPLPLAFSTLVLWAFEPTLLAFSGTAKTDLSVAFWFLVCVLAFNSAQARGKALPYAWAGALAGLTAATRYNGLLVLPVLFGMEALDLFTPGIGLKALRRRVPLWLCALGGFLLIVSLAYLPGTVNWEGHLSPLTLFYNNMAAYFLQRSAVVGQLVSFAGRLWPGGSYLNFPYHFFFKNTLSFLVLLVLAALLFGSRKIRLPRWVWVPPTVYLGLFCLLDKSMNIRHALPAYPFLILVAAYAFQWVWEKGIGRPWLRGAAVVLLVGHGVSVVRAFPRHIAYANELMDPKEEYHLLYTYNWNLGQDMKRLAELARARSWKRVKLLTEQRTDPYFYGLSWLPWTQKDLQEPQPGTVYVVEPSIFFDHQYFTQRFLNKESWLSRKRFTQSVGWTLYYYETPGTWDPASHDDSPVIDSFIYYKDGIPPYQSHAPPDSWILE
jgi:hypothetical protein